MDDYDLRSCDFMEVDEQVFDWKATHAMGMPNLPCLGQPNMLEAKAAPTSTSRTPRNSESASISLFVKQEPQDAKLAALSLPSQVRQQQTHQPMRLSEGDFDGDGGACAPSLQGFDDMDMSPDAFLPMENYLLQSPLPEVAVEDVVRVLSESELYALATPTLGDFAPSLPEVPEEPAIRMISILGQSPSPTQPPQVKRERSNTITLVAGGSGCMANADDREIMHELMADADEEEHGADHCALIPVPACRASSSELRLYDQSARTIGEMHLATIQRVDLPHAKKKPMLHEFLGLILFDRQKERLALELRQNIFFCRENGDAVDPWRPNHHFRVADFQCISEVWKRVKCNSSTDCTKNMKRAMRMSTTNDRNYFVNLTQRQHRSQIFKFGDRSMEYFRKVFPIYFA